MSFAEPIAAAYELSIQARGQELIAQCPVTQIPNDPAKPPTIDYCDGGGFRISGLDLGYGDNVSVSLIVRVNGGADISASAAFESIRNGPGCDLVCYRHTGVLHNEGE